MIAFVGDLEGFQEYVDSKGIWALLVFGGFVFFQTVSNCIPGRPFYLAAGYVLGGIKGAILCDIFATLGNTAAFLLGRKYGRNLLLYLVPEEKLEKVEDLIMDKNPILMHVLFMLLPLPKDTYSWIGFYSKENLAQWMIITFICRFPNIVLYSISAERMADNSYALFVIGAVLAVVVYIVAAVYLRAKRKGRIK